MNNYSCYMNSGNPNCPNIDGFGPRESKLKSQKYFEVLI